MAKTLEQLQSELDREITYTRKVNDKNAALMEENKELKRQIANCIPKTELERTVREYERKLSEVNTQHPRIHNERGAGRKRIASKEIMAKVIELRGQGLSQAKIAAKLSGELQIKIGRTTVGEIVRGKYTPPD